MIPNPIVTFDNARLAYGSRVLWEGLDLQVQPGEFLAVLGPNGSGKTSFINTMLGTTSLDAGTVSIDGAPVRRGSDSVGLIPQQRPFGDNVPLRARDLVALGIDGTKPGIRLARRAVRAKVDELLELVGASGYANRAVSDLSGGEQQRLRAAQPRAARIESTLDIGLQRTLEERVSSYFSQLPERTSAALLVIDNRTLEARAYVGSVAFGDKQRLGHVDMVQAWRSPGSTLKPFLYGMALDDGLIHSESLMVDAPQAFGGYRPGNFDSAFNGPVSSATALRLSLNVPAVDLLDRVGSARFAARLSHAGINLRFPHGSAPNLSLILGGTGARLEDLVGAFAAFNRNGIAGRVRYTADDAVIERRLMSPGAAWITREVLESNPRPGYGSGTFDVTGRPRVAWKTGTSYGYRDAWAIGSTRHYTVGVWVGRPDGTPLPGQYGAVTALPLMFEVVDSLPRQAGDASGAPMPPNVTREAICWPTGELAERTEDALCQRRLEAFILDGVVPPTFAERDARLWQPGRQRFNVDARSGLRVSPDCRLPHDTQTREIARWPALLSPWLPLAQRRAAQLPALSPDCGEDGRESGGSLHIEGLNDRATLARAPNAEHGVRLQLRALGNDNSVDWLLDGRWIARTEGARLFQRDFDEVGEHTLTALASDGAWTQVRFRILR